MDIPLPLIKVSLGSTWIPIALYEQFFKETFNVTAHIAKTSANKYIAKISNEGIRSIPIWGFRKRRGANSHSTG